MGGIETGRDARQGQKGRPVLYVLIAAIVLAAIAGVGMLTWQDSRSPSAANQQSQEATRESAAGSTSSVPAAKEPPANSEAPAKMP